MGELSLDDNVLFCAECGQEMWIDDDGVSYHSGDTTDRIDHDADSDHVAFSDADY